MTLNASAAEDPEGNCLLYQFFNNGSRRSGHVQRGDPAEPPAPSTPTSPAPAPIAHGRVTDVGKLTTESTPAVVAALLDARPPRPAPSRSLDMNSRLRSEDGYAVPIAIMLMAIMLGFGFAALGFVDGETEVLARRARRTSRA